MNSQTTKVSHDIDEYCHLTLWFIVELLQRIKTFVNEDAQAELAFSICCLLDAADGELFGKNVRPVIGFDDLRDKINADTHSIILPEYYSSMHDWVYEVHEILKTHPKFSKISHRGFTKADIDEMYLLI